MGREVLTEEEIENEKKEIESFKKDALQKDIDKLVNKLESETCYARMSFAKNHYVRKVVQSRENTLSYDIKCEFCNAGVRVIAGIKAINLESRDLKKGMVDPNEIW